MKKLFHFAFVALFWSACTVEDNPVVPDVTPDEPVVYNTMREALEAMPQVVKIEPYDTVVRGLKEIYKIAIEQPIDRLDPSLGTFLQEATIMFRGFDCPTVLYTNGYINRFSSRVKYEPLPELMEANYVSLEHRYFGNSTIDDPQWNYLTIRHSADDLHAFYQMLKPVLPEKWLSTGTSKDGMTTTYYRYYYPDDVDVSVPFCAPFMRELIDLRVGRYLQLESGSPWEHEIADASIRKMLTGGREGYYKQTLETMGWTEDYLSFEQYVCYLCERFFYIFSYISIPDREEVLENLPLYADPLLIRFFFDDYNPDEYDAYYPYYIQTAKQMGNYIFDFSLYADELAGTGFNDEVFTSDISTLKEEDRWLYSTYDNSVNLDLLDNFLPHTTCPMLFVYSKDDPWTAARPTQVNEPYVQVLINPIGTHSHALYNRDIYSQDTQDQIMAFIGQYINLPVQPQTRAARSYVDDKTIDASDNFMIRRSR